MMSKSLSEELLSPVGKVLQDLGKLRGAAYNDLLRLPAADPMKKVLADIDGILSHTEEEIIKAATRTGRFAPGDPLENILARMEGLREELARQQAIPGRVVAKALSPAIRRLPSPRG